MSEKKKISGFSKLSKTDKINWVAKNFLYTNPIDLIKEFADYWHDSVEEQKLFDGFSENTLTNFFMPFGVAPNFKINDKVYVVPMVIEESSVVAAASNAAKFWLDKGGFKSTVISSTKIGQVHFVYSGDPAHLQSFFPELKKQLIEQTEELTANMRKRGGGILDIELVDLSDAEPNTYQLRTSFETCDSMGANFINSVLEAFAKILIKEIKKSDLFEDSEKDIQIIMCILSNYTPECLVESVVECKVKDIEHVNGVPPRVFAEKFSRAVRIAEIDPYRATTHNKGIMNGIDAVVIATGNDFRAVESCIHTYAAKSGQYRSLSHADVSDGIFRFSLKVPLALGTVGGLTTLHPLAKKSMEMLGNPGAHELMEITAAVGLAQNFGAVKSLVTTGIQHGHMKMHLNNILAQLQATEEEAKKIRNYFVDRVISVKAVRDLLESIRGGIEVGKSV